MPWHDRIALAAEARLVGLLRLFRHPVEKAVERAGNLTRVDRMLAMLLLGIGFACGFLDRTGARSALGGLPARETAVLVLVGALPLGILSAAAGAWWLEIRLWFVGVRGPSRARIADLYLLTSLLWSIPSLVLVALESARAGALALAPEGALWRFLGFGFVAFAEVSLLWAVGRIFGLNRVRIFLVFIAAPLALFLLGAWAIVRFVDALGGT